MWLEEDRRGWLRRIARGEMLPRIGGRLAVVVGLSIVFTVWFERDWSQHITVTSTPFALVGWPLAIFLGFRNHAAYDRFWEGRKLWGALVNESRSLTRQTMTLIDDPDPERLNELRREIIYRIIGYAHALRRHLRDQGMSEEIAPFLPAEEAAALVGADNAPLVILQSIAQRLAVARRRGFLHVMHVAIFEDSLTALTDVQGACERIKSTPIPHSYTVLMHRVVGCYCALLPFGLPDTTHWLTPVVVLFVSYAFFGLDAIGDELEQPFGEKPNQLPLSSICRTIEINLRKMLGETNVPGPMRPIDHMLH